jgi:hypothetical protein
MMTKHIQRARYVFIIMERDCIYYMWKCYKCVYGDKINAPLVPLFNMMSPWTFIIWGIDVIGPIN